MEDPRLRGRRRKSLRLLLVDEGEGVAAERDRNPRRRNRRPPLVDGDGAEEAEGVALGRRELRRCLGHPTTMQPPWPGLVLQLRLPQTFG